MNKYDYYLNEARLAKIFKVYLDSAIRLSNVSGVELKDINHSIIKKFSNKQRIRRPIQKLY